MVSFGSELKALMAEPGFVRDVDPQALGAYLRFFYVPAPRAIFRGTRKVLPGCIVSVRDPRAPLPPDVSYWSAREAQRRGAADRFRGSDLDAIDSLDAHLREAVALRMAHADVPVGAFLSGGVDSSTVVALMQALSSRPIKTYTIAFGEADYDESAHAEAVARHLGTDHTALRLSANDGPAVVPSLAEIYDEPFADVSAIPTLLVSRLARRSVTVALSGDGGDEVFGGYNRYGWGEKLFHTLAPVPRPLRRLLGRGLTAVPAAGWDRAVAVAGPLAPRAWRLRLFGEKVHKVGALLPHDAPSPYYRSLVAAWGEPEHVAPGTACPPGVFEEVMSAAEPSRLLERMMLADLVTYLPDNNLAKVDRASMATSLEVRVPMLDHRLVEFSFSLPPELKVRGGTSKWILRQVLGRYVPQTLFDREKMGFDVPIGAWLRGPLREWAGDLLTGTSVTMGGVIDRAAVGAAWRAHLADRGNYGGALWAILMLRAWWERWQSPIA